jgi:hypothetical protein
MQYVKVAENIMTPNQDSETHMIWLYYMKQ